MFIFAYIVEETYNIAFITIKKYIDGTNNLNPFSERGMSDFYAPPFSMGACRYCSPIHTENGFLVISFECIGILD